ncbi:hypothetical protein H4582DRAFT_1894872 [Lactarius indigo]|nr:hypothetical protein H4582DRAFT_2021221 [Lactarius indigo]KAI9447593.1 hypothetical protein H4582DRAFT_1894872 [Lactarius indigo]
MERREARGLCRAHGRPTLPCPRIDTLSQRTTCGSPPHIWNRCVTLCLFFIFDMYYCTIATSVRLSSRQSSFASIFYGSVPGTTISFKYSRFSQTSSVLHSTNQALTQGTYPLELLNYSDTEDRGCVSWSRYTWLLRRPLAFVGTDQRTFASLWGPGHGAVGRWALVCKLGSDRIRG